MTARCHPVEAVQSVRNYDTNRNGRRKAKTRLQMKVVLFCGGQGMRIRDYSDSVPKPMVPIGYRPILWHVMKYYAHYGHKDFILCLGYKANAIKDYFLNYNEALSNDFVLSGGGSQINLLASDIHDWTITFVDTGLESSVGERLKAVESHLEGEELFLANYTDGLTDVNLDMMVKYAVDSGKVACMLGVRPNGTYHVISATDDGTVTQIDSVTESGLRINGGFFVMRREIFAAMKPGEDLMEGPFQRLAESGQLAIYNHERFWACMDTFKEKQSLDDLWGRGDAPWLVWGKRNAVESNGSR